MTDLTIILNFIIIFLLVIAIIYGFILNKRINLIRQSGKELSHLFRSFDDTILKAQNSIEDLKRISGAISEGLQKKIDKAALLMDDLEFISNKVSNIAKSAETTLEKIKQNGGSKPANVNNNIGAMPLITAKPPSSWNNTQSKPSLQSLKKKALVDLLEEASIDQASTKEQKINNNIKASKNPPAESKNVDKRQFSIASALKALGYGD